MKSISALGLVSVAALILGGLLTVPMLSQKLIDNPALDEKVEKSLDSRAHHLLSLPNYETTVNSAGGGVAMSYKKSN